ncbi:ROK family protein [Ningiella sp. W23]|uniref:ROK family protein n=1 Tax=Ningiella sp. W23 TaxID=3023715 RepID=UPI0037581806
MSILFDKRVVMTLDAGGTNFVFSAMRGGREIVEPIVIDANADNLQKCLDGITNGFKTVKDHLNASPDAISFAFPGPSDYENGIIGDLGNLPGFRGGIPLGPMLNDIFQVPVFIRNDGDLFALGEAVGGVLSDINNAMEIKGASKRYRNLVGITLGTGFGAGVVHKGEVLSGDNNLAAEIWNTSNAISSERNIEDGVSTRAIINEFEQAAGVKETGFMPADIHRIAMTEDHAQRNAAQFAFERFGLHLGDAICNLISLFDSSVVMGGGITNAAPLFMPKVMEVLNGSFENGHKRLIHTASYLDSNDAFDEFLKHSSRQVKVPGSGRLVEYHEQIKVFVAKSKLGCSKAVAIGAYAYALNRLTEN